MMKRAVSFLLILSMLLALLSACQQRPTPTEQEKPTFSALDMVTAISSATGDQLAHDPQHIDSTDPEQLATYAEIAYGLSAGEWEDCAVVLAIGAQAYEIAVLRFADEDAAVHGKECLKSYLKQREGAFTGYVPDQALLVANGVVCCRGTYVGLFICEAPDAAKEVFTTILKTGKLPEPSEPEATSPSEPGPAPVYDPELAVDMRALMVGLIDFCMDEIDAASGFRYASSFNEIGAMDASAADTFFTELHTSYGVDSDQVEAGFQVNAEDPSAHAFELTVLYMADREAAAQGADALRNYLQASAADGQVVQNGRYLALFLCADPESVSAEFEAILARLQSRQPADPTPSTEEIADMKALANSLVALCWDELADNGRVLMYKNGQVERGYGVDADQVKRNVMIKPEQDDEFAFELTVLCMVSEAAAVQGADGLQLYLWSRKADFEAKGLSDQAKVAADGCIVQNGRYLAVFACQDAELLRHAFADELKNALQYTGPREPEFLEANWFDPQGEPDPNYPNRIRYVSPGREDMSLYDTSAILDAWESGDPARLSEYDLAIYERAKSVLGKILLDGMSDYDKEVAIYAWVTENVYYDWSQLDVLTETPRTSFTPYGGLVDNKAVCLGIATTFALLMKMAGVECVTVVGASEDSVEDHAWNMVRLNGEWYCADPTWDLGNGWEWYFFNVTSDYMAKTDHQWDYANTTEATATDHGKGR